MTVIAWDGKTLAADKRSTNAGLITTTTKLRRVREAILAWTGDHDSGEMMARWYETDLADPAKFPECQKDKDGWARLIVCTTVGVFYYDRYPVAIKMEDPFMAWGSGRDFALAAMHCGRPAAEAVRIACLFENGCGNGVDAMQLGVTE